MCKYHMGFNFKEGKVRARLVARGYGKNTYTRADSSTIMKSSFRTFSTIASSKQLTIKTSDIKSAFLQYCVISLLNHLPNLQHCLA